MSHSKKIGRRNIYHALKLYRFRAGENASPGKKIMMTIAFTCLAILFFGLVGILGTVAVLSYGLPNTEEIKNLSLSESTQIFDRNGKPLYAIHGVENRENIPFAQIPKNLIDATLSIEDDEFYQHPGFDIIAIIRCTLQNIISTQTRCGGSTITQQFVKNNFLSSERTYSRKLKELILALKIEQNFTKDEILELYLNKIPYGNNAYGAELAAQTYFSKNAFDLTLAESVILASLPKAPSYYSPYGPHRYSELSQTFNEEELKNRKIQNETSLGEDEFLTGLIGRTVNIGEKNIIYLHGRTDLVLSRMLSLGFITEEEKKEAWQKIQTVEFKPARANIRAPHFVLYVKELLEKKYGKDLVEQGGLKVYTTIDLELQEKAEELIDEQKENAKTQYDVENMSLVSIDPNNGQILAMVGSADYFDTEIEGNVNVALRPRQPGSSFKPIVYAQAFLDGLGPATVLYDVPTQFGPDKPKNFDGKFFGPVSIRTALGKSRNIPAIKAYFLAGEKKPIIALAKKMGIESLKENVDYGYPLGLGSGEVSLLEMVSAYGVFATSGIKHALSPILKIENVRGDILEEWKEEPGEEVLSPEIAFLISDILSDTSVSFGRNMQIEGRTVAVKTGTSTKKLSETEIYPSNLWTIGYTPDIVTGIWAGNTDGRQLSYQAEAYYTTAPVFKNFMTEALKNTTDKPFPRPKGIQRIAVSRASGLLPGPDTPPDQIYEEYFASFAIPKEIDQSFISVGINTMDDLLATPYTPKEKVVQKSFRVYHELFADQYPAWEEGVQQWVRAKMEAGEIADMAPTETSPLHDATTLLRSPTIKILSPKPYSVLSYGNIEVETELSAPLGADRVEFYLNDQLQYTEKNPPFTGKLRLFKLLPPGSEVKIRVIGFDRFEYSASTQITVKIGE